MIGKTLLSALLFAISGAFMQSAIAGSQSALVETRALIHEDLPVTLSAYGQVVSAIGHSANVTLPTAGQVAAVFVSQGQFVKAGARLLRFRPSPESARQYAQAVAEVNYARAQLGRMRRMLEEKMATRSQLADAERALAVATAALQAQRRMGTGDASRTLLAPFSGIVSAVNLKPGDWTQPGAVALQISNTAVMRATLGVLPEDASKIRPGAEVVLRPVFEPNIAVDTRISNVYGALDPRTGLLDVSATFKNTDGLVPGMPVSATITVDKMAGWVVPRSAVLRDGQGAYVFQVSDNTAHRIGVHVLMERQDVTEIEGALDADHPVVVTGNYELHDGMSVRQDRP